MFGITPEANKLWKKYRRHRQSRFSCLWPGCQRPAIFSHLISDAVLRSGIGSTGTLYELAAKTVPRHGDHAEFRKIGIRNVKHSDTLGGPLFCHDHDHGLFKSVDLVKVIDSFTKREIYLLMLRAVAMERHKLRMGRSFAAAIVLDQQISKTTREKYKGYLERSIYNESESQKSLETVVECVKGNIDIFNIDVEPIAMYGVYASVFWSVGLALVELYSPVSLSRNFVAILSIRNQTWAIIGSSTDPGFLTDFAMEFNKTGHKAEYILDIIFRYSETFGFSAKLYESLSLKDTQDILSIFNRFFHDKELAPDPRLSEILFRAMSRAQGTVV